VNFLQKVVSKSLKGNNKKYNPLENVNSASSYDEIINLIGLKLSIKSANIRGDNKFQKANILLSDNRSSDLTRAQLKSALQYRLALNFSDSQIELIFKQLDPEKLGVIKVRQLASAITKIDSNTSQMSLTITRRVNNVVIPAADVAGGSSYGIGIGDSNISTNIAATSSNISNQRALVSYDHTIKGLTPPDPATCKKMHIHELERQIRDKLVEKSSLGSNMIQTLVKTFGDSRDANLQNQGISREQLLYTVWNRFQMRVSENDLNAFYKKYDPSNRGYITLQSFVEVSYMFHYY
jgi:Ca2+-binding EF-hand superfamily protein